MHFPPVSVVYIQVTCLCGFLLQFVSANTGLLASTLFTFQDFACDNDKLRIRCPYGTTINIQWAQYGRQVPSQEMCPYIKPMWMDKEDAGLSESDHEEDTNCLATTSLQIVLDMCQDRRDCRIMANPESFGQDPCPGTSKYLEVAYKCRPNEFRSRVTCEDQEMSLKCQKSKKIAIYSAMFGRSQRGNIECPAAPAYETDCQSSCSLGAVLQECHGKKRCTIRASESVFGNPCRPGTPKYLSVVYTCVPKRILKEMKDHPDQEYPNSFCGDLLPSPGGSVEEEDPTDGHITDREPDEYPWETGGSPGGEETIGGEPSYVPVPSTFTYDVVTASPTQQPPGLDQNNRADSKNNGTMVQCKDGETTADCVSSDPSTGAVGDQNVGLLTDWIWTWNYVSENKEKFILYICLGLCIGVILLLLVIIIRLVMTRRRKETRRKLEISEPMGSTPPPENMTLLNDSDRNDGIEMLSFNQSNSLRRPPPGGTLTRQNPYSRPDPGNHSINNYYG